MIYRLALKIRHLFYDKGWRKQQTCKVPTVCVGNITVGGTGKTPHTELIIKTLLKSNEWCYKDIAVLSRGYRRKSKGFQNVPIDGTAYEYGDEPLQIKHKYPDITVAVDKDRVEGCGFLCDPATLQTSKKAAKCRDKRIPKIDLVILDDAFQYRKLKCGVNIVLVDYNRPIFEDRLLPFGSLRDLPERLEYADIVIVTKCPNYLQDEERDEWRHKLGITGSQHLFFTTISYCTPTAVYPECDPRYIYSKKLVLFSGIANDTLLRNYLCDTYHIVKRFIFADHYRYTYSDIQKITAALKKNPTSAIATTEKDAQRVRDVRNVPMAFKERLFQVPIEVGFYSFEEREEFEKTLISAINESI